jgi:hypothetical protein
MRRICKNCNKLLSPSCDFCHSVAIKESHLKPGTYNCNGCLRRGIELKEEFTECYECEIQRKRRSAPGGHLDV